MNQYPYDWHGAARADLGQNRRLAASELPADWLPIINGQAQAARAYHMRHAKSDPAAAADVWRGYLNEFGGAAAAQLSDGQIKHQARAYANEADNLDIGEVWQGNPWGQYDRLVTFCRGREVEPPPVALLLKGMGARVRCQYWWRRALRRMVARKCERGYLAMGFVSSQNKQPYASNKAVLRRVDQNQRNAEALESIVFENDAGYRATLADLAASSVSNKAIRRGELMTRIRGCEEIADQLGHVGLFCTMTAPSRFHSTLWTGKRNAKYDGSTPRDAQKWHCEMWSKARAKLARQNVTTYGFRVAEPHHDGCTHWHMLVWFGSQADKEKFIETALEYWLSDDGASAGAKKYRCNFKDMAQGGAAGYIAKYISKNIDDHQIDSHTDDFGEPAVGVDLLGDLDSEIKPSLRVEAWATTWGIRQFQPLGQPPVTVWRELRRVAESNARLAGVGGMVHKAWMAAQKTAGVLACWARYVRAQGGLMRGRACNIVMRHDQREVTGLYGTDVRAITVGVALNCKGSRTVWSERRLWRAIESPASVSVSSKRSAPARTRVNNCTQPKMSQDQIDIKNDFERHTGGGLGYQNHGVSQNGNQSNPQSTWT